jgi:hypothetical protein
VHQVQAVGADVVVDIGHEPRGHRRHQGRGREPVAPVADEKPGDAATVLQPGLVQIQVQAIYRLDFEQHVSRQHIGGTTR